MLNSDFDDLRRLDRAKRGSTSVAPPPLGEEMIEFFKRTVNVRQTKLSAIARAWETLVPQTLSDHCALQGPTRGTLTVLVDSAVHLYELKQLLLGGLQSQLLLACRSNGLRKIVLKPGRPPE